MLAPSAIPTLDDAMADDPLMLAYAAGEPGAFDALYANHESALYRFVRRLLGVRFAGEVDEVFQETWMRIITARDSFSPEGGPWRIWAFAIAHDLAMDRLRLSGREVAFYAHDEDGDGLDAAQLFSRGLLGDDGAANDPAHPSAEERAFWSAAGRRLLACLDELPYEQRAAFLLHHEEGFTVEALAATLDVGLETVRGRLRKGLKKLRGCMERYLSVLERMPASADNPDNPDDSDDSDDSDDWDDSDDSDDLSDADLWRALEHAPDQSVVPDWRHRKAILKTARDAIGALDPDEAEAELELAARPWWRRIGPSGDKRSRMPWRTALATVLVATLVTMLWRRGPVPGPQIDAGSQQSAPAPQANEPSVPVRSGQTGSEPPREPMSSSAQLQLPSTSPPPQAPPPPPPAVSPEPASPPAAPPPKTKPPVAAVAPPAPAPAAKAPKAATAIAPPPPPPRRESADAAKPAQSAAAAAAAPALPAAVDRAPAPAAPSSAPSAARAAPPSSVRTEASEPPTFAALSQWSRITITQRGGQSRSLPRAEAGDLNALLGSAAISAVRPQPLSGSPEWRITLERSNGEVLAVFDVTPAQVRWREGKTPPATGVPSTPALSALRSALRDTLQEPTPVPAPALPRNP